MSESRPPRQLFRGLPRVDADEPLSISVAERHVKEGGTRNPGECVIAKAARARRDVVEALIGAQIVYLRYRDNPDTWVRYVLDTQGRRMVRYFDQDPEAVRAAAPWVDGQTVELQPPCESRSLGYAKKQSGTDVRSGNGSPMDRRPSLRNVTIRPLEDT